MNVRQLEAKLATAETPLEKLQILDELGDHYYDQNQYEKAAGYYQQAQGLAPAGNPSGYYQGLEGICRFLLDQDEDAQQKLLAARESLQPGVEHFDPEIWGLVHYFLGSLYEQQDDIQASLESRTEALKYQEHLDQEAQWMLLAALSRNHERQGDLRQAVEFSTQALSLISNDDPEIAYLFESLGVTHYELGEYEKALHYFSRIVEVDAGFERIEDVYFLIGLCYQRLLDFKMALDSYHKLLELRELSLDRESVCWLHIEIAHCYYRLKEHQKSIDAVERALKDNIDDKEDHAEILSYLTNNYYALGKFKEAREAGERTLKISNQFHNIEIMLPNLALSYYELGQEDKFEFYRDWCNRSFPDLSWTKQLNKISI